MQFYNCRNLTWLFVAKTEFDNCPKGFSRKRKREDNCPRGWTLNLISQKAKVGWNFQLAIIMCHILVVLSLRIIPYRALNLDFWIGTSSFLLPHEKINVLCLSFIYVFIYVSIVKKVMSETYTFLFKNPCFK